MTSSCRSEGPPDIFRSFEDKIGDSEHNREAIVRLKRERNCHVPIFRLPTEILIAIFLYNVIGGRTYFAYQFRSSFRGGWIGITHVCHFWREVAVNSASLWSRWGHSTRLSPRWVELFSSRSRQAPLYIRLRTSRNVPYNSEPFVGLLPQKPNCLGRVRELHIRGPWQSLLGILNILRPIPASDNDSANDVPECPMQSIIIHPTRSTIIQLPTFFQTLKFPHLWRLMLFDWTFDLESTIFDSAILTHLTLSVRPGTTRPVTMSRLLSILANKPRLEELIIEGFDVICAGDQDTPCVNLPHLRSVELVGTDSSCFALMTRLSYLRTRIKIALRVSGYNKKDFTSSVVTFFSKHYGYDGNRDGPPIIRQLHIIFHHNFEMRCMSDLKPFSQSSIQGPSLRLTIRAPHYSNRLTHGMVTAACTALPLHSVRKFIYDGMNLGNKKWRLNFFDAMNDLEVLEFYGFCSGDAIFALNSAEERDSTSCDNDTSRKLRANYGNVTDGSGVPDPSKTPSVVAIPAEDIYGLADKSEAPETEKAISAILLPKLKTLLIIDADFRYLPLTDGLATYLETRKHAKCELDLLSITNAINLRKNSDVVQGYEKHVKKLYWN